MKYKDRMLELAATIAKWSSCDEGKQHGCILAVDGKYVVATGYNGAPVGEPHGDCGACARSTLSTAIACGNIHAEVNAVANAARVGAPLERCVAYCTKQPCDPCRGVLKNAGVRAVYWSENYKGAGAFITQVMKDKMEYLN